MTTSFMKPTIHLNGTLRADLLEDHIAAMEALDAAIEAIRRVYPSGRDYYPQGQHAYRDASTQYLLRLAKLHSVRDELEALITHIQG